MMEVILQGDFGAREGMGVCDCTGCSQTEKSRHYCFGVFFLVFLQSQIMSALFFLLH